MIGENDERASPAETIKYAIAKIEEGISVLKNLQSQLERSEGSRVLSIAVTKLEFGLYTLEAVGTPGREISQRDNP